MKKLLILIVVGIISLFSYVFRTISSELTYSTYEVISSNWNLDIPEATEIIYILTKQHSSHGDGEEMIKFQYDKAIDFSSLNLTKLSEKDVLIANNQISQFIASTISIRNQDEATIAVFQSNRINAEVSDYYRFISRNGANDYLILLYKAETDALYVYIWNS